MRNLSYLLTGLLVIGLAFWAYRENYRTQDELGRLAAIRAEIAGLREGLSVLHAEWAYLNRPERLRELVNMNFEALMLLPLAPEQFGTVSQVAFPAAAAPMIGEMGLNDPVDVAAELGGTDSEEAVQ